MCAYLLMNRNFWRLFVLVFILCVKINVKMLVVIQILFTFAICK